MQASSSNLSRNARPAALTASATVCAVAVDGNKLSTRLSYAPYIETAGIFRPLRDVNLSPIELNRETYRIGDFILYQNTVTQEKELPGAWIGMLVDYSAGNPVYESDGVVDNLQPGEHGIDFVGICWAFTRDDVESLVNGEIEQHPNVLFKNKREFYRTFLAEDLPENVRFLSTEVEWMKISGVTGLANPDDIGDGLKSGRAVAIPFLGPWIDIDQAVKWVKKKAADTTTLSIFKQPDVGSLPSGFIEEVIEEVE